MDINEVNPAVVANGGTMNVPVLKGLTGSNGGGLGAPGDKGQTVCDAAGNCQVQTILINEDKPNYFFEPFVGYTAITRKQNTAVSSYSALQGSFRHTFTHGLTLQAAYTWEHAIDDSTSTYSETSGAINDYNLSRWKATGDLNRTQVLQLNYIYALPFAKNSSSAFVRQALGGWQISGISSFFTGEPTDFNCGVNGYASGLSGPYRCDVIGKVQIKKGVYNDPVYGPTVQWWDESTVAQPQYSELFANGEPNMFGNMGRNMLTGPGRNNWDLALEKNFNLPWFRGEHSTLQFRLETFNTWNHTQYQYANTGCNGNAPFGAPCTTQNTSPGEVNTAWDPREIQLGLKFIF